jgi:NAD+ synthase (glutamine-hydrolysing)
MYAVNSSVPKTLIKYIVRYIADKSNENTKNVLYDILNTPVSPELLPADNDKISQKTEDLVGPYELHDFFLYYVIRYGFTPSKIFRICMHTLGDIYDKDTILYWMKNFYRRFFSQQFKRSCLPDGPKVGSVNLSPRGDWKMPSDAVCNLWKKEIENIE